MYKFFSEFKLFAKLFLEQNHNIYFNIVIYVIIINKQKNINLNSVLQKFLICNEVKYNSVCFLLLLIICIFSHNYMYVVVYFMLFYYLILNW